MERQQIPDLPDNSPPILESLLKYISIDLGFDYLSLIDVRRLDPPPALGANLIMIIGSARSEKHLNVSADRLCRWLRSNYKLTPFADGLVGRNELKLKLRRKARRSKLLDAVGANEPSNRDNGISTGWVCVNVGIVEDPKNAQKQDSAEQPTYVGFGSQTEGAKVVVQMMTAEKRGEVDLEGLWQGVIARAARKRSFYREAQEEALGEQETDNAPANALEEERLSTGSGSKTAPSKKIVLDHISPEDTCLEHVVRRVSDSGTSKESVSLISGFEHMSFLPPAASPYHSQHVRGFHTASEQRNTYNRSCTVPDAEVFDESDLEPRLLSRLNGRYQRNGLTYTETTGESHRSGIIGPTESIPAFSDALTLRTKLKYLRNLPRATALKVLGGGQQDFSSTSFLSSFHQNFPAFPQSSHWDCVIELQCHALSLEHPGYSKLHLMSKLAQMAASGVELSERTFLAVFETVLLAPHRIDGTTRKPGSHNAIHALRRSLGWSFKVLEMMEAHGYDARTETVFTILHLALTDPLFLAPPPPVAGMTADAEPNRPFSLPPNELERYQYYFRKALNLLYTPTSNTLYMSMLRTYVAQDDWKAFWEVWRTMARLMRPRPPEMYTLMFRGVAQTGHEAHCQEALVEHVLEMAREKPVVELRGEVAAAVAECLFVANVPIKRGMWKKLRENCERVMWAESRSPTYRSEHTLR